MHDISGWWGSQLVPSAVSLWRRTITGVGAPPSQGRTFTGAGPFRVAEEPESGGEMKTEEGEGGGGFGASVLMQRAMEDFVAYRFPRQTNTLAFFFDPSGEREGGRVAQMARLV